MQTNVGNIDRIVRAVIGLALIALTWAGTIGVWGWIGVVPLLTAALGFCPLYTMLGFSSCPMKKA
jgi:fatty acid desaturase